MSLSPTTIGMLLAPFAYFFFTCFDTATKFAAQGTPVFQVMAVEFLVAALVIFLWEAARRPKTLMRELRPGKKRLHVWRGLILLCSQFMFFIGFQHMNLAKFYVILFLIPILTGLFSAWFLKERMTAALGVALVAGFGGVLVALRPDVSFNGWDILVLAGTLFNATALTMLRGMVKTEPATISALSLALILALGSAVAAAFTYVPFQGDGLLAAVIGGVTFGAGQRLLTRAVVLAPASFVAPAQFLQLIYGSITGFVIFADIPAASIYVGGMIVIAANLYLLHAQRKKKPPIPPVT